jgi:archaeal flagellar protein FlaI
VTEKRTTLAPTPAPTAGLSGRLRAPPVPPGGPANLTQPPGPTWDVVEVHTIEEGRTYTRVLFDRATHRHLYEVIEPVLSVPEAQVLGRVRDVLVRTMAGRPEAAERGAEAYLRSEVERALGSLGAPIDAAGRERLLYRLVRDFLGFGPIDVLMRDPDIEDISCDGPGLPLFVFHRRFESVETNVRFETDRELDAFVIRLAQRSGKQITLARPLLDATLPDGSRLQATLAREVTTRGSSVTIRKFRSDPLTPTDLVRYGTMSAQMAAYFWLAFEEGVSILFAGGTASGKTSTLNAVSAFIPPQRKIVSIEDTREINLPHVNWVASLTRRLPDAGSARAADIDMYQLLVSALRQRPEYILVGEVRGAEASTLFQAMATGHATYSTIHADSASSAVYRLENPPIGVPRTMLATLGAIAVQIQARVGERNVRRLREIVEITGIDPQSGDLLTNNVFVWDPATDRHRYLGGSHVLSRFQARRGLSDEALEREWEDRTAVIEWMVRTDLRTLKQVVAVVSEYQSNRKQLLERIRGGRADV